MPLLFSYGTLRNEETQRALFGRTLKAHEAKLPGYKQVMAPVADPKFARVSGKSQHAIVIPSSDTDAVVDGIALEVTQAELQQADVYEPAEYHRVLAKLDTGAQAWVYVARTKKEIDFQR